MSIATSTAKVQYTLSATVQALPIPFYFLEAGHIKAIRARSGAADYVMILGTDYSLSGAGDEDGGTLTTIATNMQVGDKITIKRDITITQNVNYVYNDRFPAETHERALDKLTMVAQQLKEQTDRSLQFPETEVAGVGNIMPSAASRASKILGFDPTGLIQLFDPIEGVFTNGDGIRVNTIAALKSVDVTSLSNGYQAGVAGYSAAGDGGGGTFVYVAASTDTENIGTIVAPNSGTGRWHRIVADNTIELAWFGITRSDGIKTVPAQSVRQANTAAINAAIVVLMKRGGGVLKLPAGYIHVEGRNEISKDVQAPDTANEKGNGYDSIHITVKGTGDSTLVQNHATAALLRVYNYDMQVAIEDVRLFGRGSITTGPLIELASAGNWSITNVELGFTGGIGLHIPTSDRGVVMNLGVHSCRQAIKIGYIANETYFFQTRAINCGSTADSVNAGANKASYSINATGVGDNIITSGNYYSEKRACIEVFGSQNVRFIGGSLKTLVHLAGMRFRGVEQIGVDNIYFEGYGSAAHPSIILGGSALATTLTAGINNSTLSVPLADTKWFPEDFNDDRDLLSTDGAAGRLYVIYDPADVNTYEIVSVRGFRNGSAVLGARAQGGTSAASWSSGVKFRECLKRANSNYFDAVLLNNHLESYSGLPGTATLVSSRDAGHTAGEMVVGFVWDEWHTSAARVDGSGTVTMMGNRVRVPSITNGGKFQAWRNAGFAFADPVTLEATVAVVEPDPTHARFTPTWFNSPRQTYYNVAANNVSTGMTEDNAANGEGVQLGGYGITGRLRGRQGLGITTEADKDTAMAAFTNYGAYPRFDFWVKSGGSWASKVRMDENGVAIAGNYCVKARGAAVADPAGGGTVDAECRAQLAALLARLRATGGHGLIAD